MLDDFLVRAALAALGTALAAGLLGCFVVWRRLAYFGDATAHAAILGVAVSLAFATSIYVGVGVVSLGMALLFHVLQGKGHGPDAILGVLSHGALALGLMAVSLVPGTQVNLESYLFGDIVTVSKWDVGVIWCGALVVLGLLWWHWSSLLTATLNPDLAHAAGINPRHQELLLTLLLAAVVAVSIKIVGALLITALLIIPAAAARGIMRTPEGMAVASMAFAAIAALGGLRLAVALNTQVGPSIVCVALALFALATIGGKLRTSGN